MILKKNKKKRNKQIQNQNHECENSMKKILIMTNRIRPILFVYLKIAIRFAFKSNIRVKKQPNKAEKKATCIKLVLIANECFPRRTFRRTIHYNFIS